MNDRQIHFAWRIACFWAGICCLFAATSVSAQQQSSGRTFWRDNRVPGSRGSLFLSLLGTNVNPAATYQAVIRPQMDVQTLLRTQQREIDRIGTSPTGSSIARPIGGSRASRQSNSVSAGSVSNAANADSPTNIRPAISGPTNVITGHPTFINNQQQYFPRLSIYQRK